MPAPTTQTSVSTSPGNIGDGVRVAVASQIDWSSPSEGIVMVPAQFGSGSNKWSSYQQIMWAFRMPVDISEAPRVDEPEPVHECGRACGAHVQSSVAPATTSAEIGQSTACLDYVLSTLRILRFQGSCDSDAMSALRTRIRVE